MLWEEPLINSQSHCLRQCPCRPLGRPGNGLPEQLGMAPQVPGLTLWPSLRGPHQLGRGVSVLTLQTGTQASPSTNLGRSIPEASFLLLWDTPASGWEGPGGGRGSRAPERWLYPPLSQETRLLSRLGSGDAPQTGREPTHPQEELAQALAPLGLGYCPYGGVVGRDCQLCSSLGRSRGRQ